MAKINNQAVMQKLIDELKLYPAKDTIPTEVADKILAVYQINSQEVTVTSPQSNVVRDTKSYSGAGVTVYTVPATGSFFLTNVFLASTRTGANEQAPELKITIKGDAIERSILSFSLQDDNEHQEATLNFQNPIELEQGSTIHLVGSTDGSAETNCSIVGYTKD